MEGKYLEIKVSIFPGQIWLSFWFLTAQGANDSKRSKIEAKGGARIFLMASMRADIIRQFFRASGGLCFWTLGG